MINEHRYCPEILSQLRAIRSAVKSLESEILKTHLNSCVVDMLSSSDNAKREEQIEELANLFQKFGE
jgi:DNA-binding FrmR family transcriptional regulator